MARLALDSFLLLSPTLLLMHSLFPVTLLLHSRIKSLLAFQRGHHKMLLPPFFQFRELFRLRLSSQAPCWHCRCQFLMFPFFVFSLYMEYLLYSLSSICLVSVALASVLSQSSASWKISLGIMKHGPQANGNQSLCRQSLPLYHNPTSSQFDPQTTLFCLLDGGAGLWWNKLFYLSV